MRNTSQIGDVADAAVTARCVALGWTVLRPFGSHQPYDIVIDRGAGFEKVQIKSGRRTPNGCLTFNAYTVMRGGARKSYQGQADLFGVYDPVDNSVYLVPVGGASVQPSLRLTPGRRRDPRQRDAANFKI